MNDVNASIDRLRQQLTDILNQTLGVSGQHSSPSVSVESASIEIKQKMDYVVELVDDRIRTYVKEYFNYIQIFHEKHLEEFIYATANIGVIIGKDALVFKDTVLWSEDENTITQRRRGVSDAYLTLFNTNEDDQEVIPEDFWKCLDFKVLRNDLVRCPDFQKISNIFLLQDADIKLKRMYEMCVGLSFSIGESSKTFTQVIQALLKKVKFKEALSKIERLDLTRPTSAIQGIPIEAYIPNTIQKLWYRNNTQSAIGGIGDDTKLLLKEPYQLCTGNDTVQPDNIDGFLNIVQHEETLNILYGVRRELTSIVDGVAIASKSLTLQMDELKKIPETDLNGMNSYTVEEICRLAGLYSLALIELLEFAMNTTRALENGFIAGINLSQKLDRLSKEASTYMDTRK